MKQLIVLFVLTFVSLAQVPESFAEEEGKNYTLFDIFDRFIVTAVASRLCYEPTEEEDIQFGVNILDLSIRIRLHAKEINPSIDEGRLDQIVTGRIKELDDSVSRMVKREGCDSKNVQELIALYKFHAKISLLEMGAER